MTCKGKNCNSNGKTPHSSECRFEYAANVATGVKGFTMPSRTTDHIAVLEELRRECAVIDPYGDKLRPEHAEALDAAIALMRGQSEGLSGKVRDAKFGLAMIEVDCAYFGPHMIGPDDSVRIFVEQKAAEKDPSDEQ